jgi:hypothetical protein
VAAHPYWRNDAGLLLGARHPHDRLLRPGVSAFACLRKAAHSSDAPSHPAQGSPHSAGHPAAHEAGKGELLEDAKVNEIAQRIGKTPQQVCIRWALQRCPDHSVVVKSTMPEHIKARAHAAQRKAQGNR